MTVPDSLQKKIASFVHARSKTDPDRKWREGLNQQSNIVDKSINRYEGLDDYETIKW